MSHKTIHGFLWYTYPDTFGMETEEIPDPGHPFASQSGEIVAPEEVLYYRKIDPADVGVKNEVHPYPYLVMTKLQLHPKLPHGWESDPASLSDKFKTADGKVKIHKIVQLHRRHAGDLMECELSVEE